MNLDVLEKLEAMLRHANSDTANPNEAANAMAAAQRLAFKHNIDLSDLDPHRDRGRKLYQGFYPIQMFRQPYRRLLLNTLCKNFRCAFHILRDHTSRQEFAGRVLGLEEDMKIVERTFTWGIEVAENRVREYLLTSTLTIGTAEADRARVRDEWTRGFVMGVENRFRQQIAENPGMALMLVLPSEVQQALDQETPNPPQRIPRLNPSVHGMHGYMTAMQDPGPNDGLLEH